MKRSALVEAGGGPLGLEIAGANVHDTQRLAATVDAIVVARPTPTPERPQHRCPDEAYDHPTGHAAVEAHGYLGHIRRIGEEQLDPASGEKRYPARRWVVERTLAWLSRVSGALGALRQARRQLPRAAPVRLCPALVPPSAPVGPSEIVT